MEIMQNYPFHRVALEATQFQLIGRRSVAQERAQERMSMLQNQWEAKLGRFIQSAMAEGDLYAPSILLATKARSEEHTSELQSLMRISYAVFCLKKNTIRLHYSPYNIPLQQHHISLSRILHIF